ncbi:MAG: glycosyltransferase [Desulfobacterales bacterium]|nr:glycosyltransferase [Desulfobacterales bacterium]
MKVSIITPSFNQGRYIERTILSVLNQKRGFDLEYIVIDGGSTDETLSILKKYEHDLKWISEPDQGQSEALNKGLMHMATGEILGWLNSDDTYAEDALFHVVRAYENSPFQWCFGKCRIIDENDREIRKLITSYKIWRSRHYSYNSLIVQDFIPQPAVFFTKSAFKTIGELNNSNYTMDYDYWLRLGRLYTPRFIDQWLANFRWHSASKNGRFFGKSAYEALYTASRHAMHGKMRYVILHYVHYITLILLYTLEEALSERRKKKQS